MTRSTPRASGFTLIELLIVVAVIGILAMIAFPSYAKYVLRANRTIGKTALMEIATKQESYFTDRKTYATALGSTGLNYPGNTVYLTRDGKPNAATSAYAIYRVTLTAASATSYTVQATPINAQVKDTDCGTLTYDNLGNKTASGTQGAACWK